MLQFQHGSKTIIVTPVCRGIHAMLDRPSAAASANTLRWYGLNAQTLVVVTAAGIAATLANSGAVEFARKDRATGEIPSIECGRIACRIYV